MPLELGNLVNLKLPRRQPAERGDTPAVGKSRQPDKAVPYNNQLTGRMPPELGNLATLEFLLLIQLNGEMPPELGNLANLTWLALDNNQLSGVIPPWAISADPHDNQLSRAKQFVGPNMNSSDRLVFCE